MRFDIFLTPEAVEDLQSLKANVRTEVQDALERHLRHEPAKCSKSRIKRLRGLSKPQYRLRVGSEIRVFYDVNLAENDDLENVVMILSIVSKSDADQWLEQFGESDETSSPL